MSGELDGVVVAAMDKLNQQFRFLLTTLAGNSVCDSALPIPAVFATVHTPSQGLPIARFKSFPIQTIVVIHNGTAMGKPEF